MKYERIAAAFYGELWALERTKFDVIKNVLARKQVGDPFTEVEIKAATAQRRSPVVSSGRGGTALISVFGPMAQRMSMLEESSGGCSTEEIGAALDKCAADPGIGLIVMVFDSPGGQVSGTDELARKVASIRGRKSIVGVVDSMAASAAYWVASQCSTLAITNGGMCGSIGILMAHEDISEQQKKDGVKTTVMSAGPYKTEGHPYAPISDEARAEVQSKLDYFYGKFVAAVARGRGVSEATVKAKFGGGRMMTAEQAVAVGACDRVATLQQVLSEAAGGDVKGQRAEAGSARLAAVKARVAQVERECGASADGTYGEGFPLSTRLAAIRARAVQVQVESETASAASSAPAGPSAYSGHWTAADAAKRAREIEREINGRR